VASKRSKRADLETWIAEHRPERIGPDEWRSIAQALAPVSESHLRRLVRECGVQLSPLVEGVRQDAEDELERTLLALLAEFEAARIAGDRDRMNACRLPVLTAKDHAKWAAKRAADPELRARKEEMIQWMLVWLENPSIFAQWIHLRRRTT
jgi:hypothetical protein